MATVTFSRRVRATHWTPRVEAAGVKAYTVYNHMLLASTFGDPYAEARHLKSKVQLWDVACERQVQLKGPDAAKLAQMMTPRDLSKMKDDQCVYTPTVNRDGKILNDPVTLKVAEDTWWVSIADSDVLLFADGLAAGYGLDVEVSEPDVSPLAVQGPLADDLMEQVFGAEVRDIRFFRWKKLAYQGHEFIIARSGYSKQGGFEIYVDNAELALPLWDELMEKGKAFDIIIANPNLVERIEGGMLSYGSEMTRDNTPDECGLGKFIQPEKTPLCVGSAAILASREAGGPERMIRSVAIEGQQAHTVHPWKVFADGKQVGLITSAAWSEDNNCMAALGMIEKSHWDDGTHVEVETPEGMKPATIHENPFH